MLSRFTCPILCNLMNCSPPSYNPWGFSKQEYWSGLPCPPAGDLPKPGIKPAVSYISDIKDVCWHMTFYH